MNEEKVIVRLFEVEEDFKKYGDVSMIISGFCGGVYSWEDALDEIKRAYKKSIHSANSKKVEVKSKNGESK
jgi:hypothetical protein